MIKEKRHLPIHAKKVITMNAPIKMLVINPGSTSTKVSYFEDGKLSLIHISEPTRPY